MKDINGAEITVTETPVALPAPHPLKDEWDAAYTTDAKLLIIAKALGIVP